MNWPLVLKTSFWEDLTLPRSGQVSEAHIPLFMEIHLYVMRIAGLLLKIIPGSPTHGMPLIGEPAVIGSVSPDFIMGATNTFTYKKWSLSALFEWNNGGQMYSGSNGLLDFYGMSTRTEDGSQPLSIDGVKPDGTPNDIVRGGPTDPWCISGFAPKCTQ